jgi:hypothetical protein
LKNVVDCFEIPDGLMLGNTTHNTSSNYLMTRELQSTLEVSGIEWPTWRNHIWCMEDFILLPLGTFMSSLGVTGRSKCWEAHERDQQFGVNQSIDIGKSQQLRKEGNARMNKVSAMRLSSAKIIETVCIS